MYHQGQKVDGIVVQEVPYGVYVELFETKIVALVRLLSFFDEFEERFLEVRPTLGQKLECIVLAVTEDGEILGLSIRPIDFSNWGHERVVWYEEG